MYCIDTEALVFVFNGGSSYGFTNHPIFTRICMLDGLMGPLLVYTNHINNTKYMHHGFLVLPRAYLCSTSLIGRTKLIVCLPKQFLEKLPMLCMHDDEP